MEIVKADACMGVTARGEATRKGWKGSFDINSREMASLLVEGGGVEYMHFELDALGGELEGNLSRTGQWQLESGNLNNITPLPDGRQGVAEEPRTTDGEGLRHRAGDKLLAIWLRAGQDNTLETTQIILEDVTQLRLEPGQVVMMKFGESFPFDDIFFFLENDNTLEVALVFSTI